MVPDGKENLLIYFSIVLNFSFPVLEVFHFLNRQAVLVSKEGRVKHEQFKSKNEWVISSSWEGRVLHIYFPWKDDVPSSYSLNFLVGRPPPQITFLSSGLSSPRHIFLRGSPEKAHFTTYLLPRRSLDFYFFHGRIYCLCTLNRSYDREYFSVVNSDCPESDWAMLKKREYETS